MAYTHQFHKPKVYSNVMLKLLKNNLVMGKLVTTTFKDEFKKIGNQVFVKRPPRVTIRDGRVADPQSLEEGEVAVTIDTQRGIDLEFTSFDATINVDKLLMDATLNENAAALAQDIDSKCMAEVLKFNNWVGTPGQTIDSALDFFLGPQRLDDMAVPQTGRSGILSVRDHWALAGSLVSMYNPDLNKTALEQAKLPLVGSVQPYMTQATINLTTGTRATTGAAQINGAGQVVTYNAVSFNYTQTLAIDGLAAGATIKKGEVFAIGGVYAINPRTWQTLDYLQQFVVLADAVADGGGAIAALSVACPLIIAGPQRTIAAAPADNAPITFMGAPSTTYRQNAAFVKSAIALVFAKLVQPASGEYDYSTDPDTGVSIRYWRTSDGGQDTHLHRWDILLGTTNLDPRLGTRISGT